MDLLPRDAFACLLPVTLFQLQNTTAIRAYRQRCPHGADSTFSPRLPSSLPATQPGAHLADIRSGLVRVTPHTMPGGYAAAP